MRYSIIIPVYNAVKYLEQCVDSILSQSNSDFELLLVDDGSNDASSSICDELAKKHNCIRTFHKENGGASSARNVGLLNAKGDYIIFTDSDDYWRGNDAFEILNNRINKYHEEIILYRFIRQYNEKQEAITRCAFDETYFNSSDKGRVLRWLVRHHAVPGAAWSMCVSRDLIVRTGLQFKEDVTGEDFDWVIQLLQYTKQIGCVNEVFYVYRLNYESVTSTARLSGIQGISFAIRRWFSIEDRCTELDSYLFQVLLVSLYGYRGLSQKERHSADLLLSEDIKLFYQTNYWLPAHIINIVGHNQVSLFLRYIYRLRMKMILLKTK